jgi:hypothetical protein
MLRPYEVEDPGQLDAAARREYDEWMAELEKEDAIRAEVGREIDLFNKNFVQDWPNHCTTCGGWGQFCWSENQSPLGSGENWPMEMFEPCEACIGQGLCGRCGAQLTLSAPEDPEDEAEFELPCPNCGWKCDSGLQNGGY